MVGSWPRVRITPMFGRWGYFVGPRLFACFPLRAKDSDLWIRLSPEEQRRALEIPGIVPHRRMAPSGWVEMSVATSREIGRAIRWLRRSYDATRSAVEREERG
jgi:predicted DNA-binding protein (MmcQ/YjbR family)